MTLAVAVDRALEYGTVIWAADPRFITCPAAHVQRLHMTGIHRDGSGLTGHDFFQCQMCRPPSYWFAVFTRTPEPIVFNFLLSEECFRDWHGRAGDTPGTREMLYLLRDPVGRSYNPSFRTHA